MNNEEQNIPLYEFFFFNSYKSMDRVEVELVIMFVGTMIGMLLEEERVCVV